MVLQCFIIHFHGQFMIFLLDIFLKFSLILQLFCSFLVLYIKRYTILTLRPKTPHHFLSSVPIFFNCFEIFLNLTSFLQSSCLLLFLLIDFNTSHLHFPYFLFFSHFGLFLFEKFFLLLRPLFNLLFHLLFLPFSFLFLLPNFLLALQNHLLFGFSKSLITLIVLSLHAFDFFLQQQSF